MGRLAWMAGAAWLAATPSPAATFTIVHAFPCRSATDGVTPKGRLLPFRGALYGVTLAGGSAGAGTIYRLDPATGAVSILYSFPGGAGGKSPYAGLVGSGGQFYGTTQEGGAAGLGTVFVFDPATGKARVLHDFRGGQDGKAPQAELLAAGHTLYGVTLEGGGANCAGFGCGTLFALDPATGAERVIFRFPGDAGGFDPESAPVLAGGALYGTAAFGGAAGDGLIYRIDPASGAGTVLYSFGGLEGGHGDGAYPRASLRPVGGTLYGTTDAGGMKGCGDEGCGTVFAFDPQQRRETVLHRFTPEEGGNALAELTPVADALWGTLSDGAGSGAVFALRPENGALSLPHQFTGGEDGGNPAAALVALDGALYGTAEADGAGGCGVLFRIAP